MASNRPSDKFFWHDGDLVDNGPPAWDLVYDQPDGWHLVQTVGEFLTWVAQKRPGEEPDRVLAELIDTGKLAHAPDSLLEELTAAGVITV